MKTIPCNFAYGMQFPSYPPPPSYDQSSPTSITPIGNSTPRNNPPKPVPQIPNEPDSDPSSSYSSSPNSSYSSDSEHSGYSKQIQRTCKKRWNKRHNNDPIKKCIKLTSKLLKSVYNSNVTRYKLY